MTGTGLPLEGVRVVEMTHMVMGPTCGMVLADMGAEVIKVEPIEGDRTRHLLGAGAGFFPMFNRNKKSVAINLHQPEGAAVARQLAQSADVVLENFKPGTMAKYGLDYAALSQVNPKVIYVSHKGFLPGPYENRLPPLALLPRPVKHVVDRKAFKSAHEVDFSRKPHFLGLRRSLCR